MASSDETQEQDISVENDAGHHRYLVSVDGTRAGVALYQDEPGRRTFTHTRIEPGHEGKGVGSALARHALEDTRAAGLRVVPRCPFIAEYITRHPEFQELVVAEGPSGR